MNRGIYTAANAMNACQTWMDVVSNNLANATTTGFKRDDLVFRDALLREMAGNGGTGSPLGRLASGMTPEGSTTVFTVGDLNATDNPLDLAITTDRGLFGVQDANGRRFFTRDGSFRLNESQQLTTRDGLLVLDARARPIQLPNDTRRIVVDVQGNITVNDEQVATVGVFDGTFAKYGNQLYTANDAAPAAQTILAPNSLESSNVNMVESMIQMIELQRSFEMAQRAIQNQDESTGQLIQALR